MFSQDWSQSLPRNMRGPGEGKGRGGEIPPLAFHTRHHLVLVGHIVVGVGMGWGRHGLG